MKIVRFVVGVAVLFLSIEYAYHRGYHAAAEAIAIELAASNCGRAI
jgi:hypothetical protein